MDSFGNVGGLLIGILGLAVAAVGLDPTNHYSSQIFTLGVVGMAAGGIVVLVSSRKPKKTILTQQYEAKYPTSDSGHELTKYKNLYEGSPVMQRTVNTDGIIIECNQAYVKILGIQKTTLLESHSLITLLIKVSKICEKHLKLGNKLVKSIM